MQAAIHPYAHRFTGEIVESQGKVLLAVFKFATVSPKPGIGSQLCFRRKDLEGNMGKFLTYSTEGGSEEDAALSRSQVQQISLALDAMDNYDPKTV